MEFFWFYFSFLSIFFMRGVLRNSFFIFILYSILFMYCSNFYSVRLVKEIWCRVNIDILIGYFCRVWFLFGNFISWIYMCRN